MVNNMSEFSDAGMFTRQIGVQHWNTQEFFILRCATFLLRFDYSRKS